MSLPALTWTRLSSVFLPRSSHSISVIGKSAYLFEGETEPRQPLDNEMHKVDIETGAYEYVIVVGTVPAPRVGHAAATINDRVYIFGGRGGPAMNSFEEDGGVYCFTPSTSSWSFIAPSSSSYPCASSYHCATSTPTHLIIHAGCGVSSGSRLHDTWSFEIKSREWCRLADAPGDPRGGSAICHSAEKVWRFGGYNGKTELGGGIDCLALSSSPSEPPSAEWETIRFGETNDLGRGEQDGLAPGTHGPGARSVCALLSMDGKLVTFFGEGNPSPTGGHDAAGHFWGDVWSFDPSTNQWDELNVDGKDGGPGERGWFAAADTENGVILWGGIDGRNERLGDGWLVSGT